MAGHQFSLATEETKAKIMEYMQTHRHVVTDELVANLGFTRGELGYSLIYLVNHRHLVKLIRRHGTTRFAVYNLGSIPFEKRVRQKKPEPVTLAPEEKLSVEAQGVAKVYKLLDNPLPRPRVKAKKGVYVKLQSSMNMFNSY